MRVYFKNSELLLTTCLPVLLLTFCIAGLSLDIKVKLLVIQDTKEN